MNFDHFGNTLNLLKASSKMAVVLERDLTEKAIGMRGIVAENCASKYEGSVGLARRMRCFTSYNVERRD